MKKHPLIFISLVFLFASCNVSKKINYFQDIQKREDTASVVVLPDPDIRLRPEDKISIIVSSKDPELAALFNLMTVSRQLNVGSTANKGGGNANLNGNQNNMVAYTVRGDGTIDFPVLGAIQAAGKTRDELSAYIKNELISRNLVNDPVVTVEFVNLQFSIMGEVKSPGTYQITRNGITLLDALSMAGDMNINGKRNNILVLRPDSIGQMVAYNVDMRSFADVKNSPAYYIHQNDYIYVEPNKKRANESTVNGNTVQSVGFWMSIITFITSMATTISVWIKR